MNRFYQLFYRSLPVACIWLAVVSLLWFLPFLLGTTDIAPVEFIAFNRLTIFTLPPVWAAALQFVTLLILGFSMERLFALSFLMPVRTYLFAPLLFTLCLVFPEVRLFSHQTVAFLLLMVAMAQFIVALTFKHIELHVFNLMFAVVVSVAFVPEYVIYLPFFVVLLVIGRMLTLRSTTALLLGIVLPTGAIAALVYLLHGDMQQLLQPCGMIQCRPFALQHMNRPLFTWIFAALLSAGVVMAGLWIILHTYSLGLLVRTQNIAFMLCWGVTLLVAGLFAVVATAFVLPLLVCSATILSVFFLHNESMMAHVMLYVVLVAAAVCCVCLEFVATWMH